MFFALQSLQSVGFAPRVLKRLKCVEQECQVFILDFKRGGNEPSN